MFSYSFEKSLDGTERLDDTTNTYSTLDKKETLSKIKLTDTCNLFRQNYYKSAQTCVIFSRYYNYRFACESDIGTTLVKYSSMLK